MTTTSRKPNKYRELEQIKKHLEEQAAKLRAQARDLEERLAAVTLALQVWKNEGPVAASKVELNPYLRSFRGMTQVQALVKLATDSGNGRFKLKEAKRTLLEAGLVRSKKNAIRSCTLQFTGATNSRE